MHFLHILENNVENKTILLTTDNFILSKTRYYKAIHSSIRLLVVGNSIKTKIIFVLWVIP